MIENQYNSQHHPATWTINDFNERKSQRVLRKFINSAIYVEKAVIETQPHRKTSPISVHDNSDESDVVNIPKLSFYSSKSACDNISKSLGSKKSTKLIKDKTKNKSLTCESSHTVQLGNRNVEDQIAVDEKKLNSSYRNVSQTPNDTNDQLSSYSSVETSETSSHSEITVKAKDCHPSSDLNSELRLSLTYLDTNRTDRTSTLDPKIKQEIVQNWMTKKNVEIKRRALQEAKMNKQKEEERQRLIQKERETFKKWLAEKKKEEERKKYQKEIDEQEQKLKEVEKEKRDIEKKKIEEKLALLRMYEEKKIRVEENERAYQEWLKNSKNRQKPIPMNKGLESLRLSASVTYINPLPWSPNIDPVPEPISQ